MLPAYHAYRHTSTKDKERNLAGTERIRTYHEPDNRVVDHASDFCRHIHKTLL